jgi:2-methylcitrate dehydratase PrpD
VAADALAAAFARHAAGASYAKLSPAAVAKAKTFLLDTLGVALAGSTGAALAQVEAAASGWGAGEDARVWVGGRRLPAGSAAIVNAYLIHCLEFDCVHEGAVVHPMATLVSALLAWCERASANGDPVDGSRFLAALAVGVDVAGLLGVATDAPVRFFRPATAGGFGAVAAISNLAGFDEATTASALGCMYGQACGTLQPHAEGSVLLGLQIGFNARGAIAAADLAAAGVRGPVEPFLGRYGYFALMEQGSVAVERVTAELGRVAQVERLSHKPYPSGRLTHGVVHALSDLQAADGFAAGEVTAVVAHVPPLVARLVGRPLVADPASNYAKLCLPFVAGVFLARGRCDVPDFRDEALRDPAVHRHAAKVRVVQDANPDENALDPQTIEVTFASGASRAITLPHVYGHPEAPLTEAENEAKFRRCLSYAVPAISPARGDRILALVRDLEAAPDVSALVEAMAG